jgi:tetratricopeptide (TPR) repeat protein
MAKAHFILGEAYANHAEPDKAIKAYDRAVEIGGRNLRKALRWRAGAKVGKGQYEEALEDISRALGMEPNHIETLENRATVYYGLGRFDAALADIDKVISLDPNEPAHYVLRGTISVEQARREELPAAGTRFAKAISDFQTAISLNVSYTEAYVALSRCYIVRGEMKSDTRDYQLAFETADRGLRIQPDVPDALHFRAFARLKLGHYEAAAADNRRSLELAPADWAYRAEALTLRDALQGKPPGPEGNDF